MLKARLYDYEIKKKEEENQKNVSEKTDIGWGHQIRSYVLQPYQLVKDLRYKIESSNPTIAKITSNGRRCIIVKTPPAANIVHAKPARIFNKQ